MKKTFQVILVNLVLVILCLEAVGAAVVSFPWSVGRIYSPKGVFLERIEGREGDYRRFLSSRYDPLLGWTSPRLDYREIPNCRGDLIVYHYDQRGARNTPSLPAAREILVFGDSYTHGDEVNDADTYPSQLSDMINRPVVNYGVGAYGPLQAALRFVKVAPRHPDAEAAVLGIMSENPFRMLNSFRPVYQRNTGALFGFKPFMRDGRIHDNLNDPPVKNMADLVHLIENAYTSDYYRLPEAKFPFSISFVKGLLSNDFYLRQIKKMNIVSAWELDAFQENLKRVISLFIETAETNRIKPIILWIPQFPSHRHPLAQISMKVEREFGDRATFVVVSNDRYDWTRYNLKNSGCHPSPYGYRIIAEHVAKAVASVTNDDVGRSALNRVTGTLGR